MTTFPFPNMFWNFVVGHVSSLEGAFADILLAIFVWKHIKTFWVDLLLLATCDKCICAHLNPNLGFQQVLG